MTRRDAGGLVPVPHEVVARGGERFVASGVVRVGCDDVLQPAARLLVRSLGAATTVDACVTDLADADVRVTLTASLALAPGGYELEVAATGVTVRCADLAGGYAAVQTLRQLAGPDAFRAAAAAPTPWTLPAVVVRDSPRFAWRGVLLDVARHFMPKDAVLRFVDLAAMHKLNVLHLHLTDDQGWRVEIQSYPELTRVGSWRHATTVGTWRTGSLDGRPHGGFYTQDDLREIVAYAAARGLTVVPEIDVPGHVQAALAAYPELGDGSPTSVRTTWGVSTEVLTPSDESLTFFRRVLDEVMDVFDGPWVCLGGDEVPTARWRADPRAVARAETLGLADVGELHGWFVAQLCEHLRGRGRRALVWDEALGPQLPRDAVVLAWRGPAHGAAALARGHDVVMAPEQFVYLDHRESDRADEPVPVGFVRTVQDVHGFDPLAGDLAQPGSPGPGRLLGAQAQVWSEHLDTPRRVDYAAFPRLAAFAEAVWSAPAERGPGTVATEQFMARLAGTHLARLDAVGVEYRPLEGPRPWQTRPGVVGFPRDLDEELAAGGWTGVGGWHEPDGAS